MRTALIAIVGSLVAAALVLSSSLAGSVRYFVCPLQFLVVFILLVASAFGGRTGRPTGSHRPASPRIRGAEQTEQ